MPRPGQLLPFDTYERRQEVLAGYDALSDLDLIAPSEFAPLGARMEDADIEWGLLARIIWK